MVQLTKNDDGTWTCFYMGKVVGYVNKCRLVQTKERAYRAVGVHGQLCYARTLNWARTRLMEMYH